MTADHGNADHMLEPDGSPNTAHSLNPVPIVITARRGPLRDGGILADVAPDRARPARNPASQREMTGKDLIQQRLRFYTGRSINLYQGGTAMSLLIKPQPLTTEFDRLFGRMFDAPVAQRWVPAMDLTEAEDHYLLKADLPGLSEDDIAIEFEHGSSPSPASARRSTSESEKGWHRIERSFGSFSRTLTLPEGVDAEAVSAEFDRGVLNVRIPKPEQVKPRRIEIKAANGDGKPPLVEG